jgi:hypothetical protein
MSLIILTLELLLGTSAYPYNRLSFLPQTPNTDVKNQIAEKVYLHVDRNIYNSGDDIWFKAYVVNPSTNKLSLNTNNLHVELISKDCNIIYNRVIRIQDGTGYGDFALSDSLQSGRYNIRAYTNHMRNYDEEFFFLKEITIINPYENFVDLKPDVKKIEKKIDINFFPEGGSLIDNVSSTVAFKAVNALGKGCDVTVELYSSTSELMTIFNSTHLGMGFFNIKPLPGYTYYTIVKAQDGTITKATLPNSFQTGLAIRTVITPEKKLILTINTNETTLNSIAGKELSVTISARNIINEIIKLKVDSLVNNYLIPLDSIPDGIVRLTLSEFEGFPLCERLVFLQRKENAILKVSIDKTEYIAREKVIAEISISGDSSVIKSGYFSLSATEERFTDNISEYPRSIASWFLLESDVKGIVEDPSWYFDSDNKNRFHDLDVLLMTQGWRDFKWKYDTLNSFRHEIGFELSGNVRRLINNKPIPGIKINLGLFSNGITEFMDTKTDKNGLFSFEELNIYGRTGAFVSSTDKFEKMQGKIYINPTLYYPPLPIILKTDENELELLTEKSSEYRQEAIIKINNIKRYKLSDTINIGEVTITATKIETTQEVRVRESRKFYSNPDKEHIVPKAAENFVGDVFTYIAGRIPGVNIVRASDQESLYYPDDVKVFIRGQFTIDPKTRAKIGALVTLDGYEIDEASIGFVLSLPMNIIDRVDVLNASPLYGMRGANGIMNIITKSGVRRDPVKLTPNSVYTSIQGFNEPRIFYSPKYDNKMEQTSTPDFRSSIFWSPDIKIETDGSVKLEYYNVDSPAKIKIIVEGVTKEGIPLANKLNYIVK